jgi:hypothetical protein
MLTLRTLHPARLALLQNMRHDCASCEESRMPEVMQEAVAKSIEGESEYCGDGQKSRGNRGGRSDA